jgi:hypothetical protein
MSVEKTEVDTETSTSTSPLSVVQPSDKKRQWKIFLRWLPIVISFFSVAVSIASAHFSVKVNQSLKTLDLMLRCQERYERIYYDIRSETNHGSRKAEEYYDRYWGLQIDQYQYWKEGFIDSETYSYWMHLRNLEWQQNDKVGELSYQDGWKYAIKHLGLDGSDFHRFMTSVFNGKHHLVSSYRDPVANR